MIIFIVGLIFTLNAWSMDIVFEFTQPSVKQGSIVSTKIKIDAASFQESPRQKLSPRNFSDTIYLHETGTLIRKEGSQYFEADAKVIFLKIPESNQLSFNDQGINFKVFWNNLEVLPTEAGKSFLYGTFSVPERFKKSVWIVVILVSLLILATVFFFYKRFHAKKMLRQKLINLKSRLMGCQSYDEVVAMWMQRQIFLAEFSQVETAFRKFEQVLFKYQFKPKQSEQEKIEVMECYKNFLTEIKVEMDGI